MTSIAFVSVKGGVGKTTLALETASALANDFNKKVLLIDANFSAPNLGLYLGVRPDFTLHHVLNEDEGLHAAIYEAFGFDFVPASMYFKSEVDPYKLKSILEKYRTRYDFIILDSSPHHSEILPVLLAADRVFVVTTPDRITMHTSIKAANAAKRNNTPIDGVIINKIKDSRYELDLQDVESKMSLPVIARVKDNVKMLEAIHFKVPITVYDSLNEISKEVKKLAGAIAGEKEEKGFFEKIFGKNFMKKESVNREMMRHNFYEKQL